MGTPTAQWTFVCFWNACLGPGHANIAHQPGHVESASPPEKTPTKKNKGGSVSSAGSTLRGANGYFQAISADSKVRVRLTVLEIVAVGLRVALWASKNLSHAQAINAHQSMGNMLKVGVTAGSHSLHLKRDVVLEGLFEARA